MTDFVLVHGAWHGAWCWDLLVAELTARGHRAVAVDLPIEDPDAGAEAYARTVLASWPSGAAEIVLVGHSLAGLTVPVVAQLAPDRVRRVVLLAPMLPYPGRSSDETRADDPDRLMPGLGAGQLRAEDGSTVWQPTAAIATMYPDAPPELARWAADRLRRQYWKVTREVTPLTAWPAVDTTVIACANDAVVNPDWVRRTARVRFGAEAIVLPGDHSPFLARPGELAEVLLA